MVTTTITVNGMTCGGCANSVTKALQGVTRHYKALQGITRHYKALQGITRHYKALQGITRHYKALQGVTGVQEANVNLQCKKATVTFDDLKTSVAILKQAVEDAGYDVES